MKKLASVLVLLAVVGIGQAGEKEIIERLEVAGVGVGYEHPKGVLPLVW